MCRCCMPMQLGEYEQAVRDYSAALQLDTSNTYAFYNRGITRDRLGDFEGAVEVGSWWGGVGVHLQLLS